MKKISRTIIQYFYCSQIEDGMTMPKKNAGFRIYIKNGITQNKEVEEMISDNLDELTAIRIRQSEKGNRKLFSFL